MQSDDLISVIMGVYYHRDTIDLLERAIQSILQQTYGNFEPVSYTHLALC